ncbi:MAG: GNAT family N-acetyltransferase [Boseongicola sp.]
MRIEIKDSVSEEVYSECRTFPNFNLYHSKAWHLMLRDAFGWRVRAVMACGQSGEIVGYLPFVSKRRFGRIINVALPLSHRVGVITRSGDAEIVGALCRSVEPLELHAATDGAASVKSGLLETVADLSDVKDSEDFRPFLGKGIRRDLKDAGKAGICVRSSDNASDFAIFRKLQTETRRRQGAPDYPSQFFPAIQEHLASAGLARVHLSELNGIPVAGVVSLSDPDKSTLYYGYGASVTDKKILKMRVNQAALWDALAFAIESGANRFSFGSTPVNQDALWKYKERFGGKSTPIEWATYGAATSSISTEGLAARIGAHVLRTLPVPVFRAISPLLLKEVV